MSRPRCARGYFSSPAEAGKRGSAPTPRARVVKGAIGFDETWRVFVNVSASELQGSAGIAKRKTITKTIKKDS